MKLKSWILITCSLLMGTSAFAGQPTYKMGETMFVETGVEAPDLNPTWYAAMVAKPYAPVFEMLATQGTQGRYYPYTYPVTLKDMVRYHGHDCEGTTTAANSAWVAFKLTAFRLLVATKDCAAVVMAESMAFASATATLALVASAEAPMSKV